MSGEGVIPNRRELLDLPLVLPRALYDAAVAAGIIQADDPRVIPNRPMPEEPEG